MGVIVVVTVLVTRKIHKLPWANKGRLVEWVNSRALV